MSDRVVYFNGLFVPERDARVSIYDSALQFGDMAFESTRTFAGRPFRLAEHLARLADSLAALEIDAGLSLDELERLTLDTLARNTPTEPADIDWQIVHNVSRGPLSVYRAAADEMRPTVLIACWPLVPQLARMAGCYRNGVDLVIPAQRHLPAELIDPRAKTRSRASLQRAALQAERIRPGSWALLVDPKGRLTEGTSWNVFLVKQGVLFTPEAGDVLPGISRSVTLDIARAAGIEVREASLTPDDARQADEIFCTATSFCLVHAAAFEGKPVGDGRPGPVFSRLVEGWKNAVGLDFRAQADRCAAYWPEWERRELASRPPEQE